MLPQLAEPVFDGCPRQGKPAAGLHQPYGFGRRGGLRLYELRFINNHIIELQAWNTAGYPVSTGHRKVISTSYSAVFSAENPVLPWCLRSPAFSAPAQSGQIPPTSCTLGSRTDDQGWIRFSSFLCGRVLQQSSAAFCQSISSQD